jgi:hypothetical protein
MERLGPSVCTVFVLQYFHECTVYNSILILYHCFWGLTFLLSLNSNIVRHIPVCVQGEFCTVSARRECVLWFRGGVSSERVKLNLDSVDRLQY